jgi:hypothetical protein
MVVVANALGEADGERYVVARGNNCSVRAHPALDFCNDRGNSIQRTQTRVGSGFGDWAGNRNVFRDLRSQVTRWEGADMLECGRA